MQTEHPDATPAPRLTAADVMTAKVITVAPDAPIAQVAHLLLDTDISAVPVVDGVGEPIGMLSKADLIGRGEAQRAWWLAAATGKQLPNDANALFADKNRTAADAMSAPLVTVDEHTEVTKIAELLGIYGLKQVPVLRDSRIVGIVSRADLLRTAAPSDNSPIKKQTFLASLFQDHYRPSTTTPSESKPHATQAGLTVDDFRHLVDDYHDREAQTKEDARATAADHRQHRAAELIDAHVSDEMWRDMLHRARVLADHGQTEYMVLSFPNQLCIDGGRAINVGEDAWPTTLRGEPAEIYLRWERELKPRGFHLSAHVLSFPGGKPGDIGLFLVWKGIA